MRCKQAREHWEGGLLDGICFLLFVGFGPIYLRKPSNHHRAWHESVYSLHIRLDPGVFLVAEWFVASEDFVFRPSFHCRHLQYA